MFKMILREPRRPQYSDERADCNHSSWRLDGDFPHLFGINKLEIRCKRARNYLKRKLSRIQIQQEIRSRNTFAEFGSKHK